MNPASAPAPTPAPLHDIVGPVWFWPYPLWMTVLGALALLLVLLGVVLLLKKILSARKPVLSNREKALAALEAMRPVISSAEPYTFGVSVSDALRRYITAEYGLRATTQTSVEFLNAIRAQPVFSTNEKEGLGEVLERTDLLKFARSGANESELLDLLDIAGRLVRGEPQSGRQEGRA